MNSSRKIQEQYTLNHLQQFPLGRKRFGQGGCGVGTVVEIVYFIYFLIFNIIRMYVLHYLFEI